MILNFIIKDIRPITTVEGEGFQNLIHLLEPGYQIPSRKHFTKHLNIICSEGVHKLMLTEEASSIAITRDTWTSSTNDSYISFNCAFYNKRNKLYFRDQKLHRAPHRYQHSRKVKRYGKYI